jgi:sugar lactone lactonase YvrE
MDHTLPLFAYASILFACTVTTGTATDGGDSSTTAPTSDGGDSSTTTPLSDGGTGGADAACTTTAMGTLTVTITGLPASVSPNVTLAAAAGLALHAGANAVASGDYTVTAAMVTQADPIVRTVFQATVTGASGHLCDGQNAAVGVAYAAIPTSNKLWIGNQNASASTLGYASSAIASSGSPAATVAAKTKGSLPGAFDKDGNLWLIDTITNEVGIRRFSAASMGTSGAKTADKTITSAELSGGVPGPAGLAFDASGNLWVSIAYSNKVERFDAAIVATGGDATPAVQWSGLTSPTALAFDASGNLWIADGGTVVEVTASHLAASGSSPDLVLTAMTPGPVIGQLTGAVGLAFDAPGGLWVDYGGTLARLATADQSGGGPKTITPAVQITSSVTGLPEGIAFDESGGLWMAFSQGKFGRLAASMLTASGHPTPEIGVSSADVGSATSVAFYPAPAALPLFDALK